jgi:hypothetical protein
MGPSDPQLKTRSNFSFLPTWVPPSLSALRAFETAARTLSFTAAAEELNQTQGAISHQVNMLEARLGLKLFVRDAADSGSPTPARNTSHSLEMHSIG